MSDTHRRCKELLQQNGFSLSQPLEKIFLHNYQQLELFLILQMEWCITHHIKAQYIETTLQCTEMLFNLLRYKVERVPEAVSGFTNRLSFSY